MIVSSAALAQDAGAPGYEQVTSDDLVAMLCDPQAPTVFDVRSGEEFGRAHLPGSTLLPWTDATRFVAGLPAEKTEVIVFYCNGPT